MATSLRCRLRLHDWVLRRNDAGEKYYVCRRCARENTKLLGINPFQGGY